LKTEAANCWRNPARKNRPAREKARRRICLAAIANHHLQVVVIYDLAICDLAICDLAICDLAIYDPAIYDRAILEQSVARKVASRIGG